MVQDADLSDGLPTDPPADDRSSGMRVDISISIGYRRRRAGLTDRWESRFTTGGLLLVGALVVVVVLVVLIPRILGAL